MKTTLVLAFAVVAVSASAQVVLTGPGTYYQDFNTLNMSGTGFAWTNNLPAAGMQGWYSNQTTYDADNGTSVLSGQYSYGGSNPERALGSMALPGALIVYGARVNNASGGTFGSLLVSYTGEQYRDGSASFTDVLNFEYSTNATSMLSGTWTPVTALDFNSVSNVGAGTINGNLPANQAILTSTITGLSWANGTDVWIRWKHVGNASRDAMSIDDVHLTAAPVPEPVSLAVLGVGCVGLIRSKRAKKAA